MQDRRDADGLADFAQAGAGVLERRLRRQPAALARGDRRTAGLEHQDVLLEQRRGQIVGVFIGLRFRVVAADDADDAADAAGDDRVVERPERGPVGAAEHVLDGIDAEAGDHLLLGLGDEDLVGIAVLEVVDRALDDRLGRAQAIVLVEAHVVGADGLGDIGGGNHFGVVGGGDFRQTRHAALHVDHHHLDRAGDDRQFLLQEVAGDRHAMPHQDLVGRAAQAGQGHALGSRRLGIGDDLGILDRDGKHIGERRLVAVNRDVHGILAKHAQVGGTADRARGTKQDIGNDRTDPRPAPAIRQRRAERMPQQVFVIVVDAHRRPVHRFDHHPVNAERHDILLFPDPLLLQRRQLQGLQRLLLRGELAEEQVGQIERHRFLGAASLLELVQAGRVAENPLVLDLVAAAVAFRHILQQQHQVPGMVGVRRRAARDLAEEIAGRDRVGVGAANPARGFRRDPAGTHVAVLAAHALLAETTLGFQRVVAVEDRADTVLDRLPHHLDRCRVDGAIFRLFLFRILFHGDLPTCSRLFRFDLF